MRIYAQEHQQSQQEKSDDFAPLSRAVRSQEVHPILHLQRTIGNRAVLRMLQTHAEEPDVGLTSTASPRFRHDFSQIPNHPPVASAIQTKLAINKSGDQYEQEADHISEQVMRMREPQLPRGGERPKCQTQQPRDGDEHIHTKRVGSGDWGQSEAPPVVHEALRSSGQPLDSATRAFMEPRFGYDFSHVRVHTDAKAAESARAVGALAYTVGRDVVLGDSQYSQETVARRHLLAHELAHVVQQNGSAVALQRKDAETQEREKWQQALKGKTLPTARRVVDEKETPFFVEGLIETSKILEPYLQGKLAKTSVAKNFHVYGSREEFDYKANELVEEKSSPGTKFGGFFHRRTDSIHLPPRSAFGHALHEGIHKYSAPVVLSAFGQFLNEGVTQYFADRVQVEHGVEGEAQNEYGEQLECAKIVVSWLRDGEKTLAEAYFQGKANLLGQEINDKLGINAQERSKLVSSNKLCERIKQKGRSR